MGSHLGINFEAPQYLWSGQAVPEQPITILSPVPCPLVILTLLLSAFFLLIFSFIFLCVFQVRISHRGTQPSRMCPSRRNFHAMFSEHYLVIYRKPHQMGSLIRWDGVLSLSVQGSTPSSRERGPSLQKSRVPRRVSVAGKETLHPKASSGGKWSSGLYFLITVHD